METAIVFRAEVSGLKPVGLHKQVHEGIMRLAHGLNMLIRQLEVHVPRAPLDQPCNAALAKKGV